MRNSTSAGKCLTAGLPLHDVVVLLDFDRATQLSVLAGGFDAIWLAAYKTPVMTMERVEVIPQYTFGDDQPVIVILFLPGAGGKGRHAAMLYQRIQQFFKGAALSAHWRGSVCVGTFILVAAGLLPESSATTHWSIIKNLQRFPKSHVYTNIYPGFSVDPDTHRFSGGGVSSSIDLAMELMVRINGKEAVEAVQVAVQFASDPPVDSGDPSTASPCLVEKTQGHRTKSFLLPIESASEKNLAGVNSQTSHLQTGEVSC